ncbi:hypothetical protein PR048_005516 [Dryococelus australis]|uniref:SIAH-type domain-containing protein n=1 Tax=Dryococelus australis TaxID=614101 RepID=A0ABQ9I8C9_9NEOP|nr:hypothetical protein PR048_005516 [Dryococelus australis]
MERLSQSERLEHERTCPFSRNTCPIQSCLWQGDTAVFVQHITDAHQLTLLIGDSITIDISQFRAKMNLSDKKTRKYCVSLFCYSTIFTCKIYLQKKTLRMVFMKVCCSNRDTCGARRHFGASLDIRSSFKTLKGIMPISHCSKTAKELNVSCEGLLSPWKKTEESVKIAITIKPLS